MKSSRLPLVCLLSLCIGFTAGDLFTQTAPRAPDTLSAGLRIDPEPAVPLPWTRQIPPAEPYGAQATWVCLKTEGIAELVSPVSVYAITHPTFGYAVRPGKWYWRKMDADLRQKMITGSVQTPSVFVDPEVSALKTKITKAVEILQAP